MGTITVSLAASEIVLSIIKSVILNVMYQRNFTEEKQQYAVAGAVFSFFVESCLGFALAAYLVYTALVDSAAGVALQFGVVLILGTEILTVVIEARLIYKKLTKDPRDRNDRSNIEDGRRRREVMKFITFVSGLVSLSFTLSYIGRSEKALLFYEPVTTICIAANIAFFLLAHAVPQQVHVRAIGNLVYMTLGVGSALIVQFGAWYSDEQSSFPLDLWVAVALFCSAITSACTAVGAWGLKTVQEHKNLDKSHAQLFEIGALGLTGSAVSMAFAATNGRSARIILQTVVPQVVAILLPFVTSYVLHVWGPRNR